MAGMAEEMFLLAILERFCEGIENRSVISFAFSQSNNGPDSPVSGINQK